MWAGGCGSRAAAGGLTPIRPNWDGTLPVPGDGRYEWAGFYDADQLPGAVNPDQGFLATANECNLPEDLPPDRRITYDWYAPSRRHCLDEVLAETMDATPESMVALQSDVVSTPGRRIVNRLRALHLPEDIDGLALLLGWDGDLVADSAAAALFEVWYRRHVRPALLAKALEAHVGAERAVDTATRIAPAEDLLADARIDLELVEAPGDRLGPHPEKVLADTVDPAGSGGRAHRAARRGSRGVELGASTRRTGAAPARGAADRRARGPAGRRPGPARWQRRHRREHRLRAELRAERRGDPPPRR